MKEPSEPRVIFTAGVFDLFHRGHLNILWRSKQLGDILVVGVLSDAGAAQYKPHPPVENLQLRIKRVQRLNFVDVVEIQPTTDPTPLLEKYRPDVMTHGDDWSELLIGMDTIERLGVEWKLLPHTPEVSTSTLRKGVQLSNTFSHSDPLPPMRTAERWYDLSSHPGGVGGGAVGEGAGVPIQRLVPEEKKR